MGLRESNLRHILQMVETRLDHPVPAPRESGCSGQWEDYWSDEVDFGNQLQAAVHRYRTWVWFQRALPHMQAGVRPESVPPLRVKYEPPVIDLRSLRHELPLKSNDWRVRAELALTVAEGIIRYIKAVEAQVKDRMGNRLGGPVRDEIGDSDFWAAHLIHLANASPNTRVPEGAVGSHEEQELHRIFNKLDWRLLRELKEVEPPLTWQEVLFHYLRSLDDHRGDRESKRATRAFGRLLSPATRVYCLDCGEPIEVDQRHRQHWLVCRTCHQRERQRRCRQRKRLAASTR